MALWPADCSLLRTIHYSISIGFQDIVVQVSRHSLALQDINSGHILFQDIISGHAVVFQGIEYSNHTMRA